MNCLKVKDRRDNLKVEEFLIYEENFGRQIKEQSLHFIYDSNLLNECVSVLSECVRACVRVCVSESVRVEVRD